MGVVLVGQGRGGRVLLPGVVVPVSTVVVVPTGELLALELAGVGPDTPEPEGGDMIVPHKMTFGPDGHLYVGETGRTDIARCVIDDKVVAEKVDPALVEREAGEERPCRAAS